MTGLYLQPFRGEAGLPTVVVVHGGSANWYEFFLDPLNRPGLAQYLAQKLPVLLVTIPGNYKDGGWRGSEAYDERVPQYVVGATSPQRRPPPGMPPLRSPSSQRASADFSRRRPGARLLVVGHSTGGEPFLLHGSSLKERFEGCFLGWGTGGPAALRRDWEERTGKRAGRIEAFGRYPQVSRFAPAARRGTSPPPTSAR